MPHRIAQEILQLAETQRLFRNVGFQYFDINRLFGSVMKHLPFIGVAKQRIAFMEVTRAERLQRVFLSEGLKQVLVGVGQSPAAGQVVAELADQHRRRAFAVIADTTADPTDVELVTGRQQRFQQQVTVIFASRSITGAVVTAHEIEIQWRLCTRVVAVIHPQQTDQFEGNGSHGHQGAEVNGSGQKTLRQASLIETGQPGLTDDGQGQFILQTYRFTILEPGFAQGFQLGQQIVVMLVTGLKEQRHQRL